MTTQPQLALVLSGGGARASYQVGVLLAIAERVPNLKISIITGVSAGAINAIYLAAHPGPFLQAVQGLRGEWLKLTPDQVYRVRPLNLGRAALRTVIAAITGGRKTPASVRGLMEVSPLRRFLEQCTELDGIQRNIEAGRLRAIALSTTCYSTGETVTFVQDDMRHTMWRRHMRRAVRVPITLDHVMASSAIPIVFPAVRLGASFYGDGSVRQTAPLAPAIHLGANRILAVAMREKRGAAEADPIGDYPAAVQVFGLLLHSIFLDALDADMERLERLNHLLDRIPGDRRPANLRPIDLQIVRPSRDLGALARDCKVHLPGMVQLAIKSIGGRRVQASDFLSYLMFQPEYTGAVMDLGYEDAGKAWGKLERFLAGETTTPVSGKR